MAKFKVGDIVKVIDPHLDNMEKSHDDILWVDSMRSRINHLFKVTIVTPDGGYYIDDESGFMWSGEWLEKKEKNNFPSRPDDRSKRTGEMPYKRRVVIEITDDGATAEYIVGRDHEKGVIIRRHPKDKPNDKYAALIAVSKLFGLDGTVEKFVSKDKLNALGHSIENAKGYLDDAEAIMKNITAAGK